MTIDIISPAPSTDSFRSDAAGDRWVEASASTVATFQNLGHLPVQVFDVDPRTGFMPSNPPLGRLPPQWEAWEAQLDSAKMRKLQCGDKIGLTEAEAQTSALWRAEVRQMRVVPLSIDMLASAAMLRRAHVVLSFLLHYYVQTLPPHEAVIVPRSIAVPMLRVSKALDIPALLTFSDTVLYNWAYRVTGSHSPSDAPAFCSQLDNLCSQTTFTGLVDEEEFYLCSARIELRGVEALELMRQTMDEIFVGDALAVDRISTYLQSIVAVVNDLKTLLLDVRKNCDPERYYNEVRPWFRGQDSDVHKRKWVFEGMEEHGRDITHPTELSGPSAGQSSLVHVLDIFLGVDHRSKCPTDEPSFMSRMLTYMPRNHRLFLKHLTANPRPLREFVLAAGDARLLETYNRAVLALKEFRDAHMIIATLYIIGPARRAEKAAKEAALLAVEALSGPGESKEPLKGTGGTDLVKFLKDTRNRTGATMLCPLTAAG